MAWNTSNYLGVRSRTGGKTDSVFLIWFHGRLLGPGVAEDMGDMASRTGQWTAEKAPGAATDAINLGEDTGTWLWKQTKAAAVITKGAAIQSGKFLVKTMEDNAHENMVLSGKSRARDTRDP